jgi:hypothetical protein
MPTRTDGAPSMMNSHCQPSSPQPVRLGRPRHGVSPSAQPPAWALLKINARWRAVSTMSMGACKGWPSLPVTSAASLSP